MSDAIVYAVRCKGNKKYLCGTMAKDRVFYQGFVDLQFARLFPTTSGATSAMKNHKVFIDSGLMTDWPDDPEMEIIPIKLTVAEEVES